MFKLTPLLCCLLLWSGAAWADFASTDGNGNTNVNCQVGCGSSGGGATSVNQATQITAEQAIQAAAGATADAAYAGSGNASMISILKGIFAYQPFLPGIATTVNQATQITAEQAIQAGAGAPADAIYGGSGSASLVSISKGSYNVLANFIYTATNATSLAAGTTADAAYAGSGSASIISAIKGVYAAIVGSPTVKLGDGTNTANVLAPTSASNASGAQAAALTAGAFKEATFTTTIPANLASTDVSNYKWVSVQITSQGGSSTVTPQGSNDNSTWVAIGLANTLNVSNPTLTSLVATGIFHGPIAYRFFRLAVTGIASGTTAGVVEFYTAPSALPSFGVQNNITQVNSAAISTAASGVQKVGIVGNAGAAFDFAGQNAASPANSVLNGCQFNTTPSTISTGNSSPEQCDSLGSRKTALTASAQGGYSFTNMTTATTTTAKSGAGTLHSISINTKGVTATATIFDNTAGSGTKIATIDLTLSQDVLLYDVAFATGLTIVTTGGTPADITVTWK